MANKEERYKLQSQFLPNLTLQNLIYVNTYGGNVLFLKSHN